VNRGAGGKAEPVLAAAGLRLTIGARCLFDGLNWQVARGDCWGILGLNGAGKTSLMHVLAGLRQPDKGEVRIFGRDLNAYAPRELALKRGLLEQTSFDAFSSTVLETALIGRHPHLGPWAWESRADIDAAWAALQAVGLAAFAQRDVLTLSGGERRRLALATLLTQNPPLLLLDEPTASLDLHHQVAMLDLLAQLRAEGKTLIMVLHDLSLAARYCDHLVLLDGAATRLGRAEELLRPEWLEACFRHPIRALRDGDRWAFVPG